MHFLITLKKKKVLPTIIITFTVFLTVAACGGTEKIATDENGELIAEENAPPPTPPERSECVLKPNANCINADLSGKNLAGLVIPGIDFSGANLEGALLNNAILVGADLSNTNLSGAQLSNTNLSSANLMDILAPGALFHKTDLSNALLLRADLNTTVFVETDLRSANLTGALVSGLEDRDAIWCNTIYTDGKPRNDDCQN